MSRTFWAVICLTIALGFYESFMIVYLMGMAMVLFALRIKGECNTVKIESLTGCTEHNSCTEHAGYTALIGFTALVAVCSVLLRTIIVKLLITVFHLQDQTQVLKSRGLYEFFGWFDGSRSFSDFVYIMKDFFVKYYVNAVVYLPVLLCVLAVMVLVLISLHQSRQKKDAMILLTACVIVLLPWAMPVLEGSATYYRSSQYIPLLCAFSGLLLVRQTYRLCVTCKWDWVGKGIQWTGIFLTAVLLYAQTSEMNRWLYVDAQKYEFTKNTMEEIADVILQCDDPQKPVCIVGEYPVPKSLLEDAVCPSWSKKYLIAQWLVKNLDETLWESYCTEEGYWFAETPQLSFLNWAKTAFYGFDRQAIRFWEMQGYSFTEDGNLEHYIEAETLMENGPAWPQEGSVVELPEYIIVNLG